MQTFLAFARRADESTLSRMMVETTILLTAAHHSCVNVLRDAAALYKIDIEAITSKVKQEFAVKAREKKEVKPVSKKAA